jgi:hypothetical protein
MDGASSEKDLRLRRRFWDRPNNVTGRAPNSIELNPILDFALGL